MVPKITCHFHLTWKSSAMSGTEASISGINTPTASVSLNILITTLENVKYRNTSRRGMTDIVSLTSLYMLPFYYPNWIITLKWTHQPMVIPRQRLWAMPHRERDPRQTDRAFLTSKRSGIWLFTFSGRQHLWRKMNSLTGWGPTGVLEWIWKGGT